MLRKCQIALVFFVVVNFLTACQTAAQRVFESGARAGFSQQTVTANGFDLMLMTSIKPAKSEYLHVYLEGDGMPWYKTTIVSSDPTSENVLMLDLMKLDSSDGIYLGRPCYNGTALEPECDSRLWTSARYSTTVIDALAAALSQVLRQHSYRYIRLFGHSGGGTLAMLLAQRFEQVTDVVTIAANLDIQAWTNHHGYTPLYSSLNPSTQPPLAPGVRQWHWMGGRDRVVPPALIAPFVKTQANAVSSTLLQYSHNCCWEDVWPLMLRLVGDQQIYGAPGEVFKTPESNAAGIDGRPWQLVR